MNEERGESVMEPEPMDSSTVAAGVKKAIFWALTLHPVLAILFFTLDFYVFHFSNLEEILVVVLFFQIGWLQLLYLFPLAWRLNRRGEPLAAKGVLWVSGVLFLFTSLCNAGAAIG